MERKRTSLIILILSFIILANLIILSNKVSAQGEIELKADSTEFINFDGSAYKITSLQGGAVLFNVNNEEHSIRFYRISDRNVILLIASEQRSISIFIGERKQIDLDLDNKADIRITLDSIKDQKATLIIEKSILVIQTPTPIINNVEEVTPIEENNPNLNNNQKENEEIIKSGPISLAFIEENAVYIILAFLILLILIGIWFYLYYFLEHHAVVKLTHAIVPSSFMLKLHDLVFDAVKKGVPDSKIEQVFVDKGWDKSFVDKEIEVVEKEIHTVKQDLNNVPNVNNLNNKNN